MTAVATLADAHSRLAVVERHVRDLQSVARVKQHLQRAKLTSAFLQTAPADYYSWSLSQRAQFLGCHVPHLCKSIIVENTAFASTTGVTEPLNSQFYCIVLQYNAKLNTEQLQRFVRNRIAEAERPSRKQFNFQHARASVSETLTGFQHNGVAPFGMATAIPVIVAGDVAALTPSFVWLGGGAASVKLRVSVQDLVHGLHATVGDKNLTTLRDDLGV